MLSKTELLEFCRGRSASRSREDNPRSEIGGDQKGPSTCRLGLSLRTGFRESRFAVLGPLAAAWSPPPN